MSVSGEKEGGRMASWCQRELSKLLDFPVEEELVGYLLSMQSAKDVEEYLTELLGTRGVAFRREFLSRWHPSRGAESPVSQPEGQDLMEQLTRPSQEDMVLFRGEGGRGKGVGTGWFTAGSSKASSTAPPPGFTRPKATPTSPPGLSPPSTTPSPRGQGSSSSGKKKRFVPLMSREGQSKVAMHLPGRHVCQCLAQKHELVNNCVECGRIVCSQEGVGPCVFCGSLIFPPDEEKMLAKDSKKAQKVKEKLIKQYKLQGERAFEHFKAVQLSHGLEKATQHKDKLLNFDQTSAQRTRVLDDERDFFAVDVSSWTTPEEKAALVKKEEALMERKFASRRNRVVSLDIAGKRVVEDRSEIDVYDEANVRDINEKAKNSVTRQPMTDISNPAIPIERPKFRFLERKERGRGGGGRGREGESEGVPLITRLQDRELQEMRDEGKCLSMHQPWASLLVEGIKQVEGRRWYTTHRGRLWVAAAGKVPTPEEIEEQHSFYRSLYGEEVVFPENYPTACLLGYVDMTDCLSQEEYREKYPDGESESPFVFVCQNPHSLPVTFPIRGDHKIWKLPRDVHSAAKTAFHHSLHSL